MSFKCDLDFQLFIQSIVDPQVDVSSPMSLLLNGWDVGDGSLINVSDRVRVGVVLHQTKVVEPSIIVVWICLDGQEDSRVAVQASDLPRESSSLHTFTSSSYWNLLLLTMTSSIPLRSPYFFSNMV